MNSTRTLAASPAARGARVCVVARRANVLAEVAEECKAIQNRQFQDRKNGNSILHLAGDVTAAQDMVRVRELLEGGTQKVICSFVYHY